DSTFNVDLTNVHFNAGTLRGHSLALLGSRIGPNAHICDDPAAREDNLRVWPESHTTPWTVPYHVTVDGNMIYDAEMPPAGCAPAHADLIQDLGHGNLTITNNHFWRCAQSFIQEGTLNGSVIRGTTVIKGNSFAGPCTANGGGFTHIGAAGCTGLYDIENNVFADAGANLDCPPTTGSFRKNNFVTVHADQAVTCGSGLWDGNVFSAANSNVVCGSNIRKCNPVWMWLTADTPDFTHGWDLTPALSDTCIRGQVFIG